MITLEEFLNLPGGVTPSLPIGHEWNRRESYIPHAVYIVNDGIVEEKTGFLICDEYEHDNRESSFYIKLWQSYIGYAGIPPFAIFLNKNDAITFAKEAVTKQISILQEKLNKLL